MFDTSPEELFTLIGEREFIKYRLTQEVKDRETIILQLQTQLTTARATIKIYEDRYGRLEQPTNNNTV